MKIPIVADFNKTVANQYGVLLSDGIPLRALFVIDPVGNLRQITCNDLPVGRNVDEIIRLIKAFQFVEEHGEVCPANWQPGDLTMKADPSDSKEYFHAANAEKLSSGSFSEVRDKESFVAATAGTGLTVIDYWAPWCKNCKKIESAVGKLAAGLSPHVNFIKVNTQEAESLAAENGVDALPTFQFYKDGKGVGSFKGSDVTKLEAAIRAIL